MFFFLIKSEKLVPAVDVKCRPMLGLIYVMNVSPAVVSLAEPLEKVTPDNVKIVQMEEMASMGKV